MSRSPNNPLPDFEDKNAMLTLMSTRLTETDGGFFYYPPTWSDLIIAQTVNPNFKAHHAAAVRRMKFGKLVTPPNSATPSPPSRMDILEQRLSRIIDILATNSPRSAQHRRYLLDGPTAEAHLDDI